MAKFKDGDIVVFRDDEEFLIGTAYNCGRRNGVIRVKPIFCNFNFNENNNYIDEFFELYIVKEIPQYFIDNE